LSVYYSTEKEEWLENVLDDFKISGLQANGRPIELEMEPMGSREMYLSVLDGEQPDIISPASSLQIALLEDLSKSKLGQPLVNRKNVENCKSVVQTPLVLVGWAERTQVLWGDYTNNKTWMKLHDALNDPRGWDSFNHPEWGYVKFGQTNPLTSNSGFMTILLMTYDYFQKTDDLETQDILSNERFQQWFLEIQGTISKFGNSTGTYMKEIIAYGPSMYDIVSVYEATVIEHINSAVGHYGELMVYYPPATIMSDHPFCILNGEWVTQDKEEAAKILIEYLLDEPAQEAALMEHGFRPVDKSIDINITGSPFLMYKTNGLRVHIPPEVELPPGNVLDTLLNFWSRNIQ
jgi:ABC-type sulfate transport system substrate-binding protein